MFFWKKDGLFQRKSSKRYHTIHSVIVENLSWSSYENPMTWVRKLQAMILNKKVCTTFLTEKKTCTCFSNKEVFPWFHHYCHCDFEIISGEFFNVSRFFCNKRCESFLLKQSVSFFIKKKSTKVLELPTYTSFAANHSLVLGKNF